MLRARVIPCLLVRDRQLVKGLKFSKHRYVGDPINAVRIFSERPIDELMLVDIGVTRSGTGPDFSHIEQIVSECFVPITYGGGVSRVEQVKQLIRCGVEKVSVNTAALADLDLLRKIADEVGSQALVVTIDVKRTLLNAARVWSFMGRPVALTDPVKYALALEHAGCGEIVVSAVDRDGTMSGYDVPLIRSIASAVRVPVVALGGAGSLDDLQTVVVQGNASAAAAGAMFVFQGRHRAVLINFPTESELDGIFSEGRRS